MCAHVFTLIWLNSHEHTVFRSKSLQLVAENWQSSGVTNYIFIYTDNDVSVHVGFNSAVVLGIIYEC